MQSESISHLKNPECLQIKIELSKIKNLPIELINQIVDDYVNNCCLICKSDREYNGFCCYVCEESDKCGSVCANFEYNLDFVGEICQDCLRHACSGRGPVAYCELCEGFYCTGEKGCRSLMLECDGCRSLVCNEHANEILICAYCDRLDCTTCDYSDYNVVQCQVCPEIVCKDCANRCWNCGYCCQNPSCTRFCTSCEEWFCPSCYPGNKSLCNDCESSL